MFELFQSYEQAAKEEELKKKGGLWDTNGYGPVTTDGGIWVPGDILVPRWHQKPPPGSIITQIDYYWHNANLNGWDKKVKVRLLVCAGGPCQQLDVTKPNTRKINVSKLGLQANAQLQFQMKVGETKARLYQPPYISTASVVVYYK